MNVAQMFDMRWPRPPARINRTKPYRLPSNLAARAVTPESRAETIIKRRYKVLLEFSPQIDPDISATDGREKNAENMQAPGRSKYPSYLSTFLFISSGMLVLAVAILIWSIFSRSQNLVIVALLLLTISVGGLAIVSKTAEHIYEQN